MPRRKIGKFYETTFFEEELYVGYDSAIGPKEDQAERKITYGIDLVKEIQRYREQQKGKIQEEEELKEQRAAEVARKEQESTQRLKQAMREAKAIETVKNHLDTKVLVSRISDEDRAVINKRIQNQQQQFSAFFSAVHTQKLATIRSIHPHITDEEGVQVLEETGYEENEAINYLMSWTNLRDLRRKIAKKFTNKDAPPVDEDAEDEPEPAPKPKRKKKKVYSNAKKLKLDDAIEQVAVSGSMDGWSEARVRAYRLINKNPNAYYYRFNAPGEKQRNGKWTEEEKRQFFKRMEETGVDGQWGMFSMAIRGRVGYQCANFYRQQIEGGDVKDERYIIDENGKAHYSFSEAAKQRKLKRKAQPKILHPRKRRCKVVNDDNDYMPPNAGKSRVKAKAARERLEKEKKTVDSNPLPDYIDPITFEPIKEPAISPYGHVMGYKVWLQCLTQADPKNICPYTKKTLHKRDLVKLTWDNIDQYKERMVKASFVY